MTGSQTPQRAIRRLALLGRRSDRLGSALASSPLLDDPIAFLTGASLDESALEAVLLRLEGHAAGPTAAAAALVPRGRSIAARRARRRTSPIARAFRAEAAELPVDVRHRPPPASLQPVRVPRSRIAAPAAESEPKARSSRAAAAIRAGSRAPGSQSATSSLARAAARVPGGGAAVVTPVSAEWTAAEPVTAAWAAAEPVEVPNAPALLQAVLARAGTQPGGAVEPPHGRPSGGPSGGPSVSESVDRPPHESVDRPPHRPSLADALAPSGIAARPPAQLLTEPNTFSVAPSTFSVAAEDAEVDGAPLAAGTGSSGLAELVRRWETTHDRDHDYDLSGVRLEPGRDAVAGIDAETALARAVERLLAAELRRSGIEVDVG